MVKWRTGVLAALMLGPAAAAHSPLKQTAPSDGAVLEAAPPAIRLEFADPVRLVSVALSGPGTDADLAVPAAGAARHEFAVPELSAGSYRVEWRGMAEDGHVMSGAFSFEIE